LAQALRLTHLPVHASWLNQIKICFSLIQRKVLTPNDFADLDELAEGLIAFQERYEQAAARLPGSSPVTISTGSSLASPSTGCSRPHPGAPHDRAERQGNSE
jgi:hypothetical protein